MTDPIRALRDDEVDFFQEHGWLHAKRLAQPALVSRLADKAARLRRTQGPTALAESYARDRRVAGVDEDFAAPVFSRVMADNASRLLPGRPQLRLRLDSLIIREPVQSAPSPPVFHQDFAWMPMDRSAMLTVWLALVPVRPEAGSLWFYERSHRYGTLGRSYVRDGDDALSQHPWLADLGLSPELGFEPGDATIHNSLTVHGVDEHTGAEPRMSFAWTYFDAATLYTGAPHEEIDLLGLGPNEPFDNPAFPLIAHG
ncbi:phytanoyl-CoA dioxygenase family protein [Dactylosporangium sp. NPDC051485]|uniref:phytanoyl-CoA dioxygenase family protein n=1 Tax=Dactylosporangium sp. NPDC051485 TaxID=3154846 RepID=UPI00341C3921